MAALLTAAALLITTLGAAGCSDLPVMAVTESGALYDEEKGITYVGAPVCFEPVRLEAEPFARCKHPKTELYAIEGQSTDIWIAEWFAGDISGLYVAEGTVLPTLEEFGADHLIICMEGTRTVGIGVVENAEDVAAIVDAFTSGEVCEPVSDGSSYELALSSAKYEGLYYNLIYTEGADGGNYIYDRSTKRCVNVGDALTKHMSRNTEAGS